MQTTLVCSASVRRRLMECWCLTFFGKALLGCTLDRTERNNNALQELNAYRYVDGAEASLARIRTKIIGGSVVGESASDDARPDEQRKESASGRK